MNLIDKIYQNKRIILRYFIVATLCAIFRVFIGALLSSDLLGFCVTAPIFYSGLKFFVFRRREKEIYSLLSQMMVFMLCMGGVWILRSLFVSILFILTNNTVMALGIGGAFTEILCMALMFTVAFKNK